MHAVAGSVLEAPINSLISEKVRQNVVSVKTSDSMVRSQLQAFRQSYGIERMPDVATKVGF